MERPSQAAPSDAGANGADVAPSKPVENAAPAEAPNTPRLRGKSLAPTKGGDVPAETRSSGARDAAASKSGDAGSSSSSDSVAPAPAANQSTAERGNVDKPKGGNALPPSPAKTKAATPPGPVNLHAVAFADERVGVIVGDRGTILRTNDGGTSWSAVETPATAALRAVEFVNGAHAFAVGDGGTALRSDDGGRTWGPVVEMAGMTNGANLRSVACAGSGRCIVVGDKGAFVEYSPDGSWTNWTRRGGVNLHAAVWRDGNESVAVGANVIMRYTSKSSAPEAIRIPNVGELTSVRFADPQHGLAIGTNGSSGVIVRTADAGKSWTAQPAATTSRLTSLAIVDANVMVAVGTEGTVLRTADGGVTWTSAVRGNGSIVGVHFADDDHAAAVGADGTILRSRDHGRSWTVAAGGRTGGLVGIAFATRKRAVAVGLTGTVVRSDDGGDHWEVAFSDSETPWRAVAFGDFDHALAVGNDGSVLRTADGGKTWRASSVTDETLTGVAFGDPQHAVAVGSTILRSTDGGATWSVVGPAKLPGLLQSVAFAPKDPQQRVIAVGTAGTILLSPDGGETWTAQKSNDPASLRAVAFADSRRVTVVGDNGTILLSSNGGETWPTKSSVGTHLSSVAFGDPEHGIAVGEGGTILTSRNGGETWTPIRYTRYPAPLFLLLTLGAVGFGLAWAVYAWREPPVEQRKASVTDLLGSDRPLRPGDRGAARLGHIAAGISRFIRNRNTQPPLTIAITGEWGTGKSSLMSLLHDELAGRGFRPVWFNAWHHQHGEQLLASLYANIRAQGIPPFFSLEGLDFRYDLLRIRARRSWIRVALMLLGLGFALNYFRCHIESGQFLVGLAGLSAGEFVEQLKHVSALAGVVTPMVVVLQALRGFGVDPKTLLGAVRLDRDRAVSAVPGSRFRFATEFSDVTEALKPRPLVIFIDDLDRCNPENVLEVLETVNFLVSEGECYIVLGLSRPWVETAVGLGFEQIAAETPDSSPGTAETAANGDGARAPAETDPRDKRRRFARHYLEKLVNIEVPVPALDESASTDILAPDAPEKPLRRARALQKAGRFVSQSWLPVLAIAMVVGGWYLATGAPDIIPKQETSPQALPALTPTAVAAGVALPSVPGPSGRPTPTEERAATPARFVPGATDALAGVRVLLPAVLGMLALLTLVVVLVIRRARLQTDDSNDFREALKIMRPWIILGHPTPRLLKRYVNHVRFIAMRQRTDPEPESLGQRLVRRTQERLWGTRPAAPVAAESALFLKEPQLVALSALHQSRADWQTCPDWLQRCYDKLKQGEFREVLTGREVEPKDLEKVLQQLGQALSAYNGKFTSYSLFVREENDRPAISALIETMAGVRVEWTEEHKTATAPPRPSSVEHSDGAADVR